jgi:hypothetical protein
VAQRTENKWLAITGRYYGTCSFFYLRRVYET